MLLGLVSPAKYDMLGMLIAMKDSLRISLSTITERNINIKPSIGQAKLSISRSYLLGIIAYLKPLFLQGFICAADFKLGSLHCILQTIYSIPHMEDFAEVALTQ